MSNEEVLKKSIEKAIKNGLNTFKDGASHYITIDNFDIPNGSWWMYKEIIIFSHPFAKAFWGEEEITHTYKSGVPGWRTDGEECDYDQPAWEYHLQQMVLYQNPLEYLSNFIDENDKA